MKVLVTDFDGVIGSALLIKLFDKIEAYETKKTAK
jgi:hypothetical protein